MLKQRHVQSPNLNPFYSIDSKQTPNTKNNKISTATKQYSNTLHIEYKPSHDSIRTDNKRLHFPHHC